MRTGTCISILCATLAGCVTQPADDEFAPIVRFSAPELIEGQPVYVAFIPRNAPPILSSETACISTGSSATLSRGWKPLTPATLVEMPMLLVLGPGL